MSVKSLVAAAVATIGLAGVVPAHAADLGIAPPYASGTPYDDPRYSDIYRHPAPAVPPPRYAAPHAAPYPPYAREDRYPPPPPPYAGPERPAWGDWRSGAACLPRHVIRENLHRHGWFDFQDLDVRGNVAHVRARRDSGRWFDLTVDRCTGQVLQARLYDHRAAEAPGWPPYRAPYRGF